MIGKTKVVARQGSASLARLAGRQILSSRKRLTGSRRTENEFRSGPPAHAVNKALVSAVQRGPSYLLLSSNRLRSSACGPSPPSPATPPNEASTAKASRGLGGRSAGRAAVSAFRRALRMRHPPARRSKISNGNERSGACGLHPCLRDAPPCCKQCRASIRARTPGRAGRAWAQSPPRRRRSRLPRGRCQVEERLSGTRAISPDGRAARRPVSSPV